MPLKYEDVIEADLSPLSDVAGAWRKMGDRFGELKGEYKKHVPRALANGKWQGEAFGVQQDAAKVTSFEYAAAKKEAQAIASLLKDAHTELTRLQKVLKDLVADAEAKDYKVDGSGKATYVGFDKLTAEQWESFIHDPDRTRLEAQARERAQGWTDEIAKAVKAIDESDQSIRRALDRAVTDTSPDGGGRNGFNASAVGDLKKAGAREESATQSNGWSADRKGEVTGPYADATATGVGYGKEGMAKAWVQLAHLTGQGEVTNGNFKLSGIADLTADARAMGTYGITDTGISADGGASAGVRGMVEGRVEGNHSGAYARGNYFAGAEAKAKAAVGLEKTGLGAEAFAGTKQSGAAGVEIGGIGIGGTLETWEGVGAEAFAGWEKDDDGKWHIGANAGLAAAVGGGAGAEITVDPAKVVDTVKDAGDALGEVGGALGDAGGAIKDGVVSIF
ncbi:hypothetical protein GCM10010449_45480 [Streptomyces rectiviolaceus]|uniref:PE-PGRS family protein n=1 Tax=Streptomyces rectiviolaceus TaxID=332591 RepID=A0ABP6MN69_9ACTN